MQVQKEEVRQNILSAALDIFSSIGYDAATMNQIAIKAGVGKSNLYRYYASKSDLFRALAEEAMEDIHQELMAYLANCFALTEADAEIISRELKVKAPLISNEEFWRDPPSFYINYIYPILYSRRKQILMILKSGDSMGRKEYVAEITEILEQLFTLSQHLDMPEGFSKVMANALISNICYIFCEFETEKEMYEQFCAAMYYHSLGVNYFAKDADE